MSTRSHRRILIGVVACAAVWCAGIVAGPLLLHARVGGAEDLYGFYARVCHQLDGRSWHIVGAPFAVCIRCTSIYASFLASLIVLLAMPSRWNRVPSVIPLAIAFGMVAIDALLNLAGVLMSTELHRIVTGSVVGVVLPWYIVPLLLEAVDGIRRPRRSSVAQGEPLHVRKTE